MAAPVGPNRSPDNGGLATRGMVPDEWPVQATDAVVNTIDKVRDKTTRPAILAARGLVYGLLAAIVGLVALVLVLILVVRLWANYVPGNVWWCYLLLFAVMTPTGLILLKKANRPSQRLP